MIPSDPSYMKLALELAKATVGQTGMNPSVGCVVVKEGRIVGTGAHLRMGSAHAEVQALNMAGRDAEGSTVYVTLEPCSHHGRTPPCCERLVQEKVNRVVVATLDPNPQVAGRGVAYLQKHGIAVDIGLMEEEATRLNERFTFLITHQRPFVTLKSAMTLDGRIATKTGDSKWISGTRSREHTHHLRHTHDAIMVGVQTIITDDPLLTTRTKVPGIHPVRIIADSTLRLPLDRQVVTDATTPTWVLCTEQASREKADQLQQAGVEIIRCGKGPRVDLKLAMHELYKREIGSILLEGGAELNGAMLEQRLVNKLYLFIAPKIIGGDAKAPIWCKLSGVERMKDALQLDRMEMNMIDGDCCLTGYPIYEEVVV